MIIWIALIIPVPAAAVLYWKFQHRIIWWEALLMLGTPVLCVFLGKLIVESVQTRDTEFFGGWAVTAEYFEDWNERVSCRHPRSCSHRDKDGHSKHSNDGYYHAYDVDHHPPYWQVNDSNRETVRVDQQCFEALTRQFGSRTFVELHRNFHSNDGDKYVATWGGQPELLEPVTTEHIYENRVQASQSIFNYKEVSPADAEFYGLHAYPPISDYYRQRCLLGNVGATTVIGEKRLQYLNATMGAAKQVRVFLLAFRGQPMQAAIEQESLWKGGNKNELVVCVGLDKDAKKAEWCHVFSWTEEESVKIEIRNAVMGQKEFDAGAVVEAIGPPVMSRWKRKNFKDFNYLTVEPPLWAVLTTFFVTLLVSGGVAWWALVNEADAANSISLSGARPSCREIRVGGQSFFGGLWHGRKES